MSERLQCEFSLIRYVPDVVKGEYANIGVLVRESGRHERAVVRFTRDWSRVRCLHPEADVDPRDAIFQVGGVKPIAAGAGDMVLWHQSLPHGSSPNRAARPRVAQYITMKPTRWQHNDVWR